MKRFGLVVLSILTLALVVATLSTRSGPTAVDARPVVLELAPDTTADALWTHLKDSDYRANWDLWPGKGRLYEGIEPHGMLLTTYVNGIAAEGLAAGKLADLPAGSILVKENYMPDSTLAAVTVMVRRPGYNPDHQDWLFAKYDPRGEAEAFGRVAGCQACHGTADNGAYIFTPIGD